MLHKQACYRRTREEGNRQRSGGWRVEGEGLKDGDDCQNLKKNKSDLAQDLINS